MDIEPIVLGEFIEDGQSFSENAVEFLSALKVTFPEVSYWKAGHKGIKVKDELKIEVSSEHLEARNKGLDSFELWQKSLEFYKSLGFDGKEFDIGFCPYSYKTELSCKNYFGSDAFGLNVGENKEGEVDEFVDKHKDMLVDLVKRLGKCEGIGEAWMYRNRAFAGEPYRLYQLNLIGTLEADYQKDLQEKTAYRERVKKFIDVDYARKVLVEEIGVDKFEDLGDGRIYVEFGGTWLTDFEAIEDYWDMEMGEREKIPDENNPRLDKWREIVERKVAEANRILR